MTLAAEPPAPSPSAVPQAEPRPARFSKAEYVDMVERGGFARIRRRLFLFRGELIEIPPMGWEHMTAVRRTSNWAFATLRPRFEICVQCPFDAPSDSAPEPDLAVYTPAQVLRRPHPSQAELVIEVADTSRKLDLAKVSEYAVGVREYWILDVVTRALTVFRNPHPDPAAMHGVAYDPPITLAEADTVAPLCEPMAGVAVKDLLP